MPRKPKALTEYGTRRTYFVESAGEEPDYFAGDLPRIGDLVAWATNPDPHEAEAVVPITVRSSVGEVALLDEIAKLFKQSRNVTARDLLAAAMRGVLQELPEEKRREMTRAAAKAAGWEVVVGVSTLRLGSERSGASTDSKRGAS